MHVIHVKTHKNITILNFKLSILIHGRLGRKDCGAEIAHLAIHGRHQLVTNKLADAEVGDGEIADAEEADAEIVDADAEAEEDVEVDAKSKFTFESSYCFQQCHLCAKREI